MNQFISFLFLSSSGYSNNDIAILTLCKELNFSKGVSPICLPKKHGSAYDTTKATISGWGKLSSGNQANILQKLDMSTISRKICDTKFRFSRWKRPITSDQICALNRRNLKKCFLHWGSKGFLQTMARSKCH